MLHVPNLDDRILARSMVRPMSGINEVLAETRDRVRNRPVASTHGHRGDRAGPATWRAIAKGEDGIRENVL